MKTQENQRWSRIPFFVIGRRRSVGEPGFQKMGVASWHIRTLPPTKFPLHLDKFVLIRIKNLVGKRLTWKVTLGDGALWRGQVFWPDYSNNALLRSQICPNCVVETSHLLGVMKRIMFSSTREHADLKSTTSVSPFFFKSFYSPTWLEAHTYVMPKLMRNHYGLEANVWSYGKS
jgi:hypothetical protein